MAGFRLSHNGVITDVGISARYWSSSTSQLIANFLYFHSNSGINQDFRACGFPGRCIKN